MKVKTRISSIDTDRLKEAAIDLGLSRDIKILPLNLPYDIRGVHYFRPFLTPHHTVYISRDLLKVPVLANKTLWHEIAHMVQAETCGSPQAWTQRVDKEREIDYDVRPMELEAREFAYQISPLVALVR